jgi:hypothetical protein
MQIDNGSLEDNAKAHCKPLSLPVVSILLPMAGFGTAHGSDFFYWIPYFKNKSDDRDFRNGGRSAAYTRL